MSGREYASDSSFVDSETLSGGTSALAVMALRQKSGHAASLSPAGSSTDRGLCGRLTEPQLMKPAEQWLVYICNFVRLYAPGLQI